jgi:hypothetical protein
MWRCRAETYEADTAGPVDDAPSHKLTVRSIGIEVLFCLLAALLAGCVTTAGTTPRVTDHRFDRNSIGTPHALIETSHSHKEAC